MKDKRVFKIIALILLVGSLIGCATGSVIITGKTRTAISPSEVKIYLDPPSQFETLAIIEASSDVEFSRQLAQDRVIDKLKSQAAKIGANGILLVTTGTQPSGATGFYGNGFVYSNTGDKITAQGKAIYVTQE